MCELTLVALQLRLIGAVVDLGQEIALFDELAFLKRHLDKLAVDLRLYRYGIERADGAQLGQDDADVAGINRRGADRLGDVCGLACRASGVPGENETEAECDRHAAEREQQPFEPWPPYTGWLRSGRRLVLKFDAIDMFIHN